MAYVLRFDAEWGADLRRLLRKQLREARAQLDQPGEAIHDGIHDARRALRRARAVLALAATNASGRAALETPLREAGRLLSPLRDAHSILEALDAWTGGPDPAPPPEQVRVLRRNLVRRRERRFLRAPGILDGARAQIDVAAAQVDAFAPATRGPVDGARAAYQRARRALRAHASDPSADSLHAFRRRLRVHLLHVELLHPLWPVVMAAQEGELRRLSHGIGGAQDLELLAAELARSRGADPRLVEEARRRAVGIRTEALERARTAFAERPRDLAARWRALARAVSGPMRPRAARLAPEAAEAPAVGDASAPTPS